MSLLLLYWVAASHGEAASPGAVFACSTATVCHSAQHFRKLPRGITLQAVTDTHKIVA